MRNPSIMPQVGAREISTPMDNVPGGLMSVTIGCTVYTCRGEGTLMPGSEQPAPTISAGMFPVGQDLGISSTCCPGYKVLLG